MLSITLVSAALHPCYYCNPDPNLYYMVALHSVLNILILVLHSSQTHTSAHTHAHTHTHTHTRTQTTA